MWWRWPSPPGDGPCLLAGPRRGISHQGGGIALLATSSLEVTNVPSARAGLGTPVSWQLGLSQCHLLSCGDMRGGCSGWGFPWGQQRRLAAFPSSGCLGTWLRLSMALCPSPPPPGCCSGLAQGRGGRWDRVSEPGESELLPLALFLHGSWMGATVPGFLAC